MVLLLISCFSVMGSVLEDIAIAWDKWSYMGLGVKDKLWEKTYLLLRQRERQLVVF